MIARTLAWLFLATTFFLAGCGGGSDTTTTTATAPSISTQPSAKTAIQGASASFSVVATGSDTLAYQWRKDGSAISGATAASYTIAATATTDAGSYDVVVSNAVGSVTSAAATLSVTTSAGVTTPAITTAPASQSALVGASVTLGVTATGTAPLSYQWSKDGSAIANATSASLVFSAVAATDAGSYTVTVSNSAGSVTSAAAVLTVNATSSASGTLATEATTAAQAFLATLSTSQQASVQLTWDLATARRWSNLPASMVARNGLSWSSLSTAQKTAARALITTALGATGNTLHLGLQAADDALVSLHGASSSTYGSGHYYLAFLGTPSATGFWLLQLTGHHLTYNIAFNGSVKSPTPLFLGVEPKGAFTLNGVAWDPMEAQRTAASNLGTALLSYSGALLSGTYSDLLFGANGSGGIDGTYPKSYPTTGRGLLYTSLSTADQEKAKAMVRAYVNTQATEYADDLLAAYLSDTALAQTYVAYAGTGTVSANGSYFRVDGPRVWIEFSVQRGVIISSDIHYHTIWRDKTGDYGGKCCA
jgi:hypothetical protein